MINLSMKDPVTKLTVMGMANVQRLAADLGLTLPDDFASLKEPRLGEFFLGDVIYGVVVTPIFDGAVVVGYEFAYSKRPSRKPVTLVA